MWLDKIYIFFYFFYTIFGYNSLHRYINNIPIEFVTFVPSSRAFICKRMCMLSLLTLLQSAYFLNNQNINTFLNTMLMHNVVLTGYYLKWRIDENATFYMHVFWSYPVFIYTDYNKIIITEFYDNVYINIITLSFLISYYFIQGYIYTPMLPKSINQKL